MSSAAAQRRLSPVPALLGVWAAAIVLAPSTAAKLALLAPAILLPLVWWTVQRPHRWIALFFGAALLLPPLPIALGDSGPHPSLAVAAIGLFTGALRLRGWHLHARAVDMAIAALFAVLLASVAPAALHSGLPIAGASLARVLLFGIAVYVYFYAAGVPGATGFPFRGLRWLFAAAVAAALFACVDFYFQFPAPAGFGPQFVWLDSGVYRRAQGLFYEASTLGNFCAFFLTMIAVALSRPRDQSPVSRPWLMAGGAVLFAALVLSYSRASLMNLVASLAVLAWYNRDRLRWSRMVPLAGVAAFVTWLAFPKFAEMYWLRLSATAEYLFTATEGVLSGRVASWRTLSAWIASNPLDALAGIGYKTLPYSDYVGKPIVADNMYLSLLVETGVAGLAALLWLNVAILRQARRASRSADRATSFFGMWMLCFWTGQSLQMASGDLLTYWRVLPLYFWVLALTARV